MATYRRSRGNVVHGKGEERVTKTSFVGDMLFYGGVVIRETPHAMHPFQVRAGREAAPFR